MKKHLPILLLIIGLIPSLHAQWTSPGNGTTYTLPDLVAASNGTVTQNGTVFTIHQDLTISTNDVLKIDNQVTRINAASVLITIQGSMVCTHTNDRVGLYGLNQTDHFSMRFENATDCVLKRLYFSDGAGIKVIESTMTFDDVKFLYFTRDYCNAVIDIFNCNPVIQNCLFQDNQGAAISSPANGQSSPQILNNTFDANVNGINSPQINLGPGGRDTIRIVGNEVFDRWAQFHTGGISVADLMGVGSTKVLLKDNNIRDGRYGYNQQGATISSVIVGNQFIDNNNETNPMNGGSGISIYGASTNCKAILRNNTITGNLWGITAINQHDIDLGTEAEWGNNILHGNGNGGEVYDLYNYSACDITAVGNNWGTSNVMEIENHIYHQHDNPTFGMVTYTPFIDVDGLEEYALNPEDIDPKTMTVYSITGQRVHNESLKPGTYIVVMKQGTQTKTKKIIIQ